MGPFNSYKKENIIPSFDIINVEVIKMEAQHIDDLVVLLCSCNLLENVDNAKEVRNKNILLKVKIDRPSCEAVVDNGANPNFIMAMCAKRSRLELKPLTNLSANFVQGSTNTCTLFSYRHGWL